MWDKAVMKVLLVAAMAALLCAACAQGRSLAPGAGGSAITMYGTIDEGVTLRK